MRKSEKIKRQSVLDWQKQIETNTGIDISDGDECWIIAPRKVRGKK